MTYASYFENQIIRNFFRDLRMSIASIFRKEWDYCFLETSTSSTAIKQNEDCITLSSQILKVCDCPTVIKQDEDGIILSSENDDNLIFRKYNYGDPYIVCYFENKTKIYLNHKEFEILNFNCAPDDLEAIVRFNSFLQSGVKENKNVFKF